jgi:hypothetical protein
MYKSSAIAYRVFILTVAILLRGAPARADEPGAIPSSSSAMPDSERALLAAVADAQKQYAASRSASGARDARMALQVRVTALMMQSQAMNDWVGTVNTRGQTPEGDIWISIDIGNGATISTWRNKSDDQVYNTLFHSYQPLAPIAAKARIGQRITFSGTIMKSLLTKDDDMVAAPQFIASFTALKTEP